jgi:hypothetical protein
MGQTQFYIGGVDDLKSLLGTAPPAGESENNVFEFLKKLENYVDAIEQTVAVPATTPVLQALAVRNFVDNDFVLKKSFLVGVTGTVKVIFTICNMDDVSLVSCQVRVNDNIWPVGATTTNKYDHVVESYIDVSGIKPGDQIDLYVKVAPGGEGRIDGAKIGYTLVPKGWVRLD